MVFWLFLVIVTLAALIAASIIDIKTREVPNWISYTLIVVGFGIRLIYSLLEKDFSFILYGLLGFIVFFGFANLMYYTKQWGGGDAKLLMGLGAMFGSYGLNSFLGYSYRLPFLIALLINIFVAGLFYGIIYSIYLALKHKKEFLKELKNASFNEVKIAGLAVIVLTVLSLLLLEEFIAYTVVTLLVLFFVAVLLLSFVRLVENASLYKFVEVNKLVEGDWLAKDLVIKNKVICAVRNIGLTKKDIAIIKKNKISKVLVREGIPFVPGFLLGFLITIVFGDFFILF